MEMLIKVEDYVSKETITRIVEEAIEEYAKAWVKNEINKYRNIENLFTNIAYGETKRILGEIEPDYEGKIRENVKKVIDKLSTFTVFATPSSYDSYKSEGVRIIEDETKNNEQLIREKTREIIADHLNQQKFVETIADAAAEKIGQRFDF